MVDIKAVDALTAYNNALQRREGITDIGPVAEMPGQGDGSSSDFANMLGDIVRDTVATTDRAEKAGLAAAAGQGDLIDMVTAVTNAELTLQTVTAIRDKVITAYQEISKMPI